MSVPLFARRIGVALGVYNFAGCEVDGVEHHDPRSLPAASTTTSDFDLQLHGVELP
jgi:hypothetical protein